MSLVPGTLKTCLLASQSSLQRLDLISRYHFVYLEKGWCMHITKFRKCSRVHGESACLSSLPVPLLLPTTNPGSLCCSLQTASGHVWTDPVSAPLMSSLPSLQHPKGCSLWTLRFPSWGYLLWSCEQLWQAGMTRESECLGSSPQPKTDGKMTDKQHSPLTPQVR